MTAPKRESELEQHRVMRVDPSEAINVNDYADTRDVTGIVFGDPVPERSALWKKRNGVT